MLVHSNESFDYSLPISKLKPLYDELLIARYVCWPEWDHLEEDDEAVLLLERIDRLRPECEADSETAIRESVRLLSYFLSEYAWHEEERVQHDIHGLVERVMEVLPAVRRPRRMVRMLLRGS